MLTNLVINSIRYTEQGQVRVTLHSYDAAARRLRFSVADTGPGIPEAALPTLLAPDKTLGGDERRGKGSGLGLAIVRTLVDLLGGTIAVASQLGKGTTFTLEVPAEPVEKEEESCPTAAASTHCVLVVDDRQDVLDALISVIDELGFECDRARPPRSLPTCSPADATTSSSSISRCRSRAAPSSPRRRDAGAGRTPGHASSGSACGHGEHAVGDTFDAVLAKPVEQAALRQALTGGAYLSRPSQPGLWLDAD